MIEALKRNSIVLGGVIACGLLCSLAGPFLVTARGALGPTVLQAESWPKAFVGLAVCGALAAVVAVVVGRAVNAAVGLFCLGAGVFALALRLAAVQEIAFGGGSLLLVGIETLLVGGLVLAATVAMFRFAGPLPDIEPPEGEVETESPWGPTGLTAASAGVLVPFAVWILARSPMSGQVLGATIIGGMVAGLIGRLSRPHVQPILLFASPVLLGGVVHIVAALATSGPLDEAFIDGSMWNASRAMPLDYAAGSLIGISMGLGWARSFLHHEEEDEGETEPATLADEGA